MAKAANTGKNRYWGTFIHLLAKEFKSSTIVELGACAGISGSYLASSPFCKRLITIEGSKELADIARSHISQVHNNSLVINDLFDEALDELLPNLSEPIDMCFIDGHHEKNATIHYFNRLKPHLREGSVVLFDDISWSQDMWDMWKEVSKYDCFTDSFDFGVIGLCIFSKKDVKPKYWDMQEVFGKTKISKPWGWN
jgi:predicted O-methyltransferase YrrM